MAFILDADVPDQDVSAAFRRYREYLSAKRDVFPRSAYALAISDWYFSPHDHRCPHDSRLETMTLSEPNSSDQRPDRQIILTVRLLGAYHDGHIELHYPRVFSYALNLVDGERGHWDWVYDELRVSDTGRLIHEIEWRAMRLNESRRWVIEASDLEFKWIPKVAEPFVEHSPRSL